MSKFEKEQVFVYPKVLICGYGIVGKHLKDEFSFAKTYDPDYDMEALLPDLHLRHRLDAAEVEYLIECKYRSYWGEDGIDLSSQYVRYHNAAKDRSVELFIALGVGGIPSNPDELFLIPGRMVKLDKKIDRARFIKCLCPKTPDGIHNYINHYFNKRVFKKI